MNELTECGSYLDGEKIFASESEEKAGTVQRWIPITEKLPNDNDDRFYMCTVENHEEDLPMFCQYEEEYGFGFWHNIFDPVSLGFVDSEFQTNEELGYEKVIALMQLPEPYRPAYISCNPNQEPV